MTPASSYLTIPLDASRVLRLERNICRGAILSARGARAREKPLDDSTGHVTVQLDSEHIESLDRLVTALGCTAQDVIRGLIATFLDEAAYPRDCY